MLAFREEIPEGDGMLLTRGKRNSSYVTLGKPLKVSEESLREARSSGLAALFKEEFKD